MSDERTILVQVGVENRSYPDEDELRMIRDELEDSFPDYTVVVTTSDVDLMELPALDEFADELASRIVGMLE